jgi:hypothetical protein
MRVNVGLFEVHETTRLSMARQLHSLFEKYGLMHYVIIFVKYKINNLMFMATTLCCIIDCRFETSTCLQRYVFWSHHV